MKRVRMVPLRMDFQIDENVFAAIMQTGIVLVGSGIINSLLRSLIKVPHKLDTRRNRSFAVGTKNLITLGIVFIMLYGVFKIWKIDIAPLLASAGIIGIVVGVGSRSLFEDLIAGFFLVSQARIAVGDYINLGNGTEGVVDSVGLKNTTLISGNGAYTLIPNGQIKQVTNNAFGRAQVFVTVPVKSGQPVDTILEVFREVLATFGESSDIKLMKASKVIGVNKVDVHGAYMVSVLLIGESKIRDDMEPEFHYRLIKAFEKKKLRFV